MHRKVILFYVIDGKSGPVYAAVCWAAPWPRIGGTGFTGSRAPAWRHLGGGGGGGGTACLLVTGARARGPLTTCTGHEGF